MRQSPGLPVLGRPPGPGNNLHIGQAVIGFNLTSGQVVNLTLIGLNSTYSEPLIDMNHGLLVLTATDQPVYIWNTTFEGWVVNPDNLRVGDYMFNPLDGGWTEITCLSISHHSQLVYDVVTSGVNTFIANGQLLDRKPG